VARFALKRLLHTGRATGTYREIEQLKELILHHVEEEEKELFAKVESARGSFGGPCLEMKNLSRGDPSIGYERTIGRAAARYLAHPLREAYLTSAHTDLSSGERSMQSLSARGRRSVRLVHRALPNESPRRSRPEAAICAEIELWRIAVAGEDDNQPLDACEAHRMATSGLRTSRHRPRRTGANTTTATRNTRSIS